MYNKQLIINMTANIVSLVVNLGINFILTPYLIKNVGSEAYSFYPLANSFIGYTNIITVALNSMASRFITIKIHQNDIESSKVYFNSVLFGNTIIAVILALPGIYICRNLGDFIKIPDTLFSDTQRLFSTVFLGLGISIIGSVFAVATFAKNRLELSAMRTIESKILNIILLISMFSFFKPSITYVGVANLIIIIFILITNIIYTKKLIPEIKINYKYVKLKAIKKLVSAGIWNSLNQLSTVLLSGLDLLISNIFLGPYQSSIYSVIQTIPNFLNIFIVNIVNAFVPHFTMLFAKNKKDELLISIVQSMKFLGVVVTIPIGFLLIYGDIFYSIWVPSYDSRQLQFLSIFILIPIIITGSMNTIFNIYTITNKLKTPSIVLLIIGIVKLIILIPIISKTNLGILSIPLVSSIIIILQHLIFTPKYAAKCLEINSKVFYQAIGRGILCTSIMVIVCSITRKFYTPDSLIELFFVGITCSILTLGINILTVYSKKERSEFIAIINKKLKNKQKYDCAN